MSKHRSALRAVSLIASLLIEGQLTACDLYASEPYGESFSSLPEHCDEVAEGIASDLVTTSCDEDGALTLLSDDTEYVFSRHGLIEIFAKVKYVSQYQDRDTGEYAMVAPVSIRPSDLSRDGEIQSVDVSAGGGIDGWRAIYRMQDLSRPKAFHWGDDVEVVRREIERVLPRDRLRSSWPKRNGINNSSKHRSKGNSTT